MLAQLVDHQDTIYDVRNIHPLSLPLLNEAAQAATEGQMEWKPADGIDRHRVANVARLSGRWYVELKPRDQEEYLRSQGGRQRISRAKAQELVAEALELGREVRRHRWGRTITYHFGPMTQIRHCRCGTPVSVPVEWPEGRPVECFPCIAARAQARGR